MFVDCSSVTTNDSVAKYSILSVHYFSVKLDQTVDLGSEGLTNNLKNRYMKANDTNHDILENQSRKEIAARGFTLEI